MRFRHADGDLDLELHGAGGPLATSDSLTDEERVRYQADDAETVFVRVLGFAGAVNRYALSATVTDCGCREDRECPGGQVCVARHCAPRPVCADDRLEENDSPADAAPIDDAPLQACAGDDDWFVVDVCAGGQLRSIRASPTPPATSTWRSTPPTAPAWRSPRRPTTTSTSS